MHTTPSTRREGGIEWLGGIRKYLEENAGDNSETMSRLRRNLLRAIEEELTPRQKELVLMHYFEGLRQAEIARRTGVRRSTVSRILMRAEERLEKVLKYSF